MNKEELKNKISSLELKEVLLKHSLVVHSYQLEQSIRPLNLIRQSFQFIMKKTSSLISRSGKQISGHLNDLKLPGSKKNFIEYETENH